MGIIDTLKKHAGNAKEKAYYYRVKASANTAEKDRRNEDYYRVHDENREREYQRRQKEEYDYKKREKEAKRKAEQNRVKELEVVNREKERELKRRNYNTSIMGQLAGAGNKKKTHEPYPKRQRRSTRRSYYNYDRSYQAPPRRKGMEDIDREFDKFF